MDEDDTCTDEICDLYEKHDEEALKFDRIPESDKLHVDKTLCGFLYLASLMKEPDRFWLNLSAEHDEIYLPSPDDLSRPVTEADVVYLTRCGINWDSDCERFCTFT